eukprot:m.150886 g.150886  ORF g.150886 m.150886 type:complete len:329 (+) comp20677_c1_seq2:907-1893(+)
MHSCNWLRNGQGRSQVSGLQLGCYGVGHDAVWREGFFFLFSLSWKKKKKLLVFSILLLPLGQSNQCELKVLRRHFARVDGIALHGQKCRLTAQSDNVSPRKALCIPSQLIHCQRRTRHFLQLQRNDFLASIHVGQTHKYLTIETAWPEQCRVNHVWAVGGRNHRDAVQALHAIHLRQQLAQHAVAHTRALVARAALCCKCVNLVEKNNGGCSCPSLAKHLTHGTLRLADPFAKELRTFYSEEIQLGLCRKGLSHQCLAAAWRPKQQHSARWADSHARKCLWVLERPLHSLLQLLLDIVLAANVTPQHVRHIHLHLAHGTGLHALQTSP